MFSFSSDAPCRTGLVTTEAGWLLGNEAGRLTHLDKEGARLWTHPASGEIAIPPVVATDTAAAATVGGEVTAVALSDGAERWRLPELPKALGPLLTDGRRVFLVGPAGWVRALDSRSGSTVWSRVAVSRSSDEAVKPAHAAVHADGKVVVSWPDTPLTALDDSDGVSAWKAPHSASAGMVAVTGGVVVASRTGEVARVSVEGGQTAWKRALEAPLTSPPFVAQGRLWVATEALTLLPLSLEDGTLGAAVRLPEPVAAPGAELGGAVLVVTRGSRGLLFAFDPRTGAGLWSHATDTPLWTAPHVDGDRITVAGLDGRVLAFRAKKLLPAATAP